jgi:predicted DsbA family dithiol-disulfide isomerase
MHDRLFEEQDQWLAAGDPASLMEGYAQDLGLDAGQFDACLTSDQAARDVMAGKVVAALYNVPGAPVFLFNNGEGQQGSPSFEEFQSIIDSIVSPEG